MDKQPEDAEFWKAQAAEQEAIWKRLAAPQEEESIRENNLIYGGMIGIGVVMVQPFLTASAGAIDLAAEVCVIAFSIAVPLLAALLLVNRHEAYRRHAANTFLVIGAQSVALGTGFAGVVAGFWHILPAAGISVLVCGFIALFIHSSGYMRLELDHAKAAQENAPPSEP